MSGLWKNFSKICVRKVLKHSPEFGGCFYYGKLFYENRKAEGEYCRYWQQLWLLQWGQLFHTDRNESLKIQKLTGKWRK